MADSQTSPSTARHKMLLETSDGATVQEATNLAGYRSRTTYYKWEKRFQSEGVNGLEDRKGGRPRVELAPSILQAIRETAFTHPEWGYKRVRRHLLDSLTLIPDDLPDHLVQREMEFLRSEARGLLPRSATPSTPVVARAPVDIDELGEMLLAGITLDKEEQSQPAVDVLWHSVWSKLDNRDDLWTALTMDRRIGSLLMLSRIHLGHALMNSGRWDLARSIHNRTRIWMVDNESALTSDFRNGEEESLSNMADAPLVSVFQELATVSRDTDVTFSIRLCSSALHAVTRPVHARHVRNRDFTIGNVSRQLAELHLFAIPKGRKRSRFDPLEIERLLLDAIDHLERSNETTEMIVASTMLLANLRSEQSLAGDDRREEMIAIGMRAVESVNERTPAMRTNLILDFASIQKRHEMYTDLDWTAIRQVAELCIVRGYANSAKRVLSIPGATAILPEQILLGLYALARTTL